MYCKNCGNEFEDGAKFCTSCGASVEAEAPVEEAPVYTIEDAVDPLAEERGNAGRRILALGICSVAFVSTFFFSLIGWILAAVCRGKIRNYEEKFGPVSGIAKVGKGLSLGGLIGGIIMTVFSTIFWLAYIIGIIVLIAG